MKQETIIIPATVDEAVAELGGLGALLQATEWKRAAILAAHVRLDEGSGGREVSRSGHFLSARAFADLGIVGLASTSTVTRYVKAWLDTNGGNYPGRGRKVRLPAQAWPPEGANIGSRPTPTNIGKQLRENPALAQAAADEFATGEALGHVDRDRVRDLGRTVDARIVRDAGADPKPPRITDRGKSTDELDDDAYWAKVSAALHLLLDVKVKIADGVQPPAHIAILMQILVPEQDWDEALRQEIGNIL